MLYDQNKIDNLPKIWTLKSADTKNKIDLPTYDLAKKKVDSTWYETSWNDTTNIWKAKIKSKITKKLPNVSWIKEIVYFFGDFKHIDPNHIRFFFIKRSFYLGSVK